MGENLVFLVIFDTYDVVYNLSISLLPPIELDNLFAIMPYRPYRTMLFLSVLNLFLSLNFHVY